LPGLPDGWLTIAAPYKQWLDEVGRFSFWALLPDETHTPVDVSAIAVPDSSTSSKHA